MSLPTGLLADAKNYLNITWTDTNTDAKLTGILYRCMAYLDNVAGTEQDYTVEGLARELLFDRARYALAGALDEFEINYTAELLRLQMQAAQVVEEDDTEQDEYSNA